MNDVDSIEDGPAINSSDRYQFQSSIFETPPSLLAPPSYSCSNLFSTPNLHNNSQAGRCTLCRKDTPVLRSPRAASCAHKYCNNCHAAGYLTDGSCPACKDTSQTRHQLTSLRLASPDSASLASDVEKASIPRLDSFSIWGSNGTVWDSKQSLTFDSSSRSLDTGSEAALFPTSQSSLNSCNQPLSAVAHSAAATSILHSTSAAAFLSSAQLCASCGEGHEASHFCSDCKDLLCEECVDAHRRVKMTREHNVIAIQELARKMAPALPAPSTAADESQVSSAAAGCSLHEGSRLICICETCSHLAVCSRCLPDHSKHQVSPMGDVKSTILALLADSRQEEVLVEKTVEALHRMVERVDASVQAVASELRSVVHMHISALEERKRELLQQLETIRLSKMATLKAQGEALAIKRAHLQQLRTSSQAESLSLTDEPSEGGKLASLLESLIAVYCAPRVPAEAHESDAINEDLLRFVGPDVQLLRKLRHLGALESGACARRSQILGDGFRKAIRDRLTSIHVQLRDACSEVVSSRGQPIAAAVLAPNGTPLEVHLSERDNGVCTMSYTPTADGQHTLNITVRGVPVLGCPTTVDVRRGRNYEELASAGELFSFGKEGSGDGELCRPWGICCDMLGRILVADRSNNRIQIFDKEGNFLSKFGSSGTRAGQFDRPAGITTNSLNQIIVADKDNHRIQVFDEAGNFFLKFGDRGRPVGMFNYPWGVASNSLNHIAVSDTRNHRVQIFTSMGQFIRKCGFDSAFFYKHLDSPRGLCYLPDGQLLITDFNNHRLAILSASRSSPDMKCYGSEGEAEGLFCRPQGVKTDAEGHILVCDSRNNRVQIFNAEDMRCVASFGGARSPASGFQMPAELPAPVTVGCGTGVTPSPLFPITGGSPTVSSSSGAARTVLDRPTDLCVSSDGRVYVVDFGNNCIRVF